MLGWPGGPEPAVNGQPCGSSNDLKVCPLHGQRSSDAVFAEFPFRLRHAGLFCLAGSDPGPAGHPTTAGQRPAGRDAACAGAGGPAAGYGARQARRPGDHACRRATSRLREDGRPQVIKSFTRESESALRRGPAGGYQPQRLRRDGGASARPRDKFVDQMLGAGIRRLRRRFRQGCACGATPARTRRFCSTLIARWSCCRTSPPRATSCTTRSTRWDRRRSRRTTARGRDHAATTGTTAAQRARRNAALRRDLSGFG